MRASFIGLSAARAGITKRVGVHTLRHSFGTRLLEQKNDIRIIQSLSREGLHQLLKLRPVGGGAGDLLAEYLFASGRLQLGELASEVFICPNKADAR